MARVKSRKACGKQLLLEKRGVMIRWLQRWKSFDEPLTGKIVVDLLEVYGALMEETSSAVVTDVSKLPTTKERLAVAFRAAWLVSDDETMRSIIEGCWISLASFQAGVGDVKITLPLPDGLANSKNISGEFEAVCKWIAVVHAERVILSTEIANFKAENST